MIYAGGGTAQTTLEGLPYPEGDADGLHAAAGRSAAIATHLREVGTRMVGAASGSAGWEGQAAGAFHAAVGHERDGMNRAAGALEQAAGSLRKLSTTVQQAQDQVKALARDVRAAEEAANLASTRSAALGMAAATAHKLAAMAGGDHPALTAAANSASDDASSAASAASSASTHAAEVRRAATQKAQELCDEVTREDVTTSSAVEQATAAAPLGGTYGTPSATPAQGFVQKTFSNLTRTQWQEAAYFLAGINHWNPNDGLLANDHNVRAVYAFYGNLWSEDHNLQWAGMANLVGPLFYGGWQDLWAVRNLADPGDQLGALEKMAGVPQLPGFLNDAAGYIGPFGLLGKLSNDEIKWYETRFLTMQKNIYDDMAFKHLAYSMGGVGMLREMTANGQMTQAELQPFEDIASGDPSRVAAGNKALLYREQHTIIQHDYDLIHTHHSPEGEVFTKLLSETAGNPVPGGHSYVHDYHNDFNVDVPVPNPLPWGPHDVHLATIQYPAGDVSNFNDRWRWITNDMLPNYQHLLTTPGHMQAIVNQPVADRAHQYRLLPDLPYPGG